MTFPNICHIGGNWLGPPGGGGGGDIITGLPASSLFGDSGYPAVARLVTDQKSRMAATISTMAAAIFEIIN